MQTVAFAAHTAVLDPMTGYGALVLANPADDLADPLDAFGALNTLHSVSNDEAMRWLYCKGYEPLEGDDGDLIVEGVTADGRDVIALCSLDSIATDPSPDELMAARADVLAAAGVVQDPQAA